MSQKIKHKVGVKILSDQQLENVLPTYKNLFQKIDTCREVAKEAGKERREEEKNEEGHYQYNFMYDNVFSVLGRRGTGKTSVAFTLRDIIKRQYSRHHDVIMPLIIPEVIPEDCTILGWLLAIVKEQIMSLENMIARYDDNKKEQFWERCNYGERNKREISLANQLEELSQLFYAKGYNPGTETSYDRAIDNSARQAEDYYKFAAKIAELWDAWVDRIRYLQRLEQGKRSSASDECCPMIYFIFDDVDLAPEKIEELLSVIIKYLSHPNIVVITTADEELFLEVLENRLDKKIGRYQRDLRNYLSGHRDEKAIIWGESNAKENLTMREDVISQTARMYLGKVLPTSTRFYLRLFNSAEEKAAFCLEDDKNLGEAVAGLVQELIDCKNSVSGKKIDEKKKIVNFMKAENKIINFYLKFIGNTSRQIGNAYIALQDLIYNLKMIVCQFDEKQNQEKRLRQIYVNLRYYICVAVNANHTLSNMVERVDNFADEVFLYEYNQWKMYCNYTYLNDYLHKKLADESKRVKIGIGLQTFSLLSFIENIILVMEQLLPDGITGRAKSHEVLYLAEYIGNVAFNSRTVFRSDLYPHTFFEHYLGLLNRVEAVVEDEMPDEKFNVEYFYSFRQYCEKCSLSEVRRIYTGNRKWFDEMAKMLSMVYGNVYLFARSNMEDCLIYPGRTYLIRYQKRIDTEIKNHIHYCFVSLHMQKNWPDLYTYFEELHEQINQKKNSFAGFVNQISQKVTKKTEKYIYLRQVLDVVFQQLSVGTFDDVKKILINCPADIQEDMRRNWDDILTDSNATRNLLLKYKESVLKTQVGGRVILEDVSNALNVLRDCAETCYPLSERLNETVKWLMAKHNNGKNPSTIMDRATATEFVALLKKTHKLLMENSRIGNYYEGDIDGLCERVKELFGSMDMIVESGESVQSDKSQAPTQQFQTMVRLGIQVTLVKLLQTIYIYQTIHEKYEKKHSMSSRELEQAKIGGAMKETYYSQFYRNICSLMETAVTKTSRSEPIVGIADVKEDISVICMSARNHYLDALIERVEDE